MSPRLTAGILPAAFVRRACCREIMGHSVSKCLNQSEAILLWLSIELASEHGTDHRVRCPCENLFTGPE
jgi:hypothetical protein